MKIRVSDMVSGRYKLLIINALYLFVLTLYACQQSPEENPLGIGLVQHIVDARASKCTLSILDKGVSVVEYALPIRKGVFITDSAIVTGGSVMLDVRKAVLISKSAPDTSVTKWLKQINNYYSRATDSTLIFKLNLVSPVPILPNHNDSGHTVNATHIITASLDKGDTSNQFTFRIGLRGMPQKVNFDAVAHCNPGLFGISPSPKGLIARFTINLSASPKK